MPTLDTVIPVSLAIALIVSFVAFPATVIGAVYVAEELVGVEPSVV